MFGGGGASGGRVISPYEGKGLFGAPFRTRDAGEGSGGRDVAYGGLCCRDNLGEQKLELHLGLGGRKEVEGAGKKKVQKGELAMMSRKKCA